MRLIRLSTAYRTFLDQMDAEDASLRERPFADQHRALLSQPYGWNNLWTLRFGALGYDVLELVCNAEPAQRRWAAENGLTDDDPDWVRRITAEQIKQFRPDVLVSNDYGTFTEGFLKSVRAECPSIKLTVGWCGGPYTSMDPFRGYDLMLTNLRRHVAAFREAGMRAEHMQHGFDPWWLETIDQDRNDRLDFSFVGSVIKAPGFHNERERLLLHLLRETDLTIFADLPRLARPLTRSKRAGYRLLRAVQKLPGGTATIARVPRVAHLAHEPISRIEDLELHPLLVRRARPAVFGRSMYQTLHDSRLTLNTHIDIALDNASNMRLFEATGVGTCLLTERQPDLAELFEPDVEVATYASPPEAVEKARYLLDHDDVRRSIADAGQARVQRDHTFAQRAQWMDQLFRSLI